MEIDGTRPLRKSGRQVAGANKTGPGELIADRRDQPMSTTIVTRTAQTPVIPVTTFNRTFRTPTVTPWRMGPAERCAATSHRATPHDSHHEQLHTSLYLHTVTLDVTSVPALSAPPVDTILNRTRSVAGGAVSMVATHRQVLTRPPGGSMVALRVRRRRRWNHPIVATALWQDRSSWEVSEDASSAGRS